MIRLWNENGNLLKGISDHDNHMVIYVNWNDQQILVSCSHNHRFRNISFWKEDGSKIFEINYPDVFVYFTCLAWGKNQFLATGQAGGIVRLWDVSLLVTSQQ